MAVAILEQVQAADSSACICESDGWCERMNHRMVGDLRTRCRVDPAWREQFAGMMAGKERSRSGIQSSRRPCRHRGELLRVDEYQVKSCSGCVGKLLQVEVYPCGSAKRTAAECSPAECLDCKDYEQPWPLKFTEHNLFPEMPGKRFNPSLIEWEDGYLMAYRDGWAGSEIHALRMSKELQPVGRPTKLELFHPLANFGREDPRLFMHNGQLHVVYIGVEGKRRVKATNVLYARLANDLRVEQLWAIRLDRRNGWEKNWMPISCDGELYFTYGYQPHRVLKVQNDSAEWAHETPNRIKWRWGEIRGGAAPMRVGDEYWSFFHSSHHDGIKTYVMGLLTHDVRPPFQIRRYVPLPLLVADATTRPADQYCRCVFPGGAVRNGNEWIIACGIHDRWMELHKLNHDDLERQLVTI